MSSKKDTFELGRVMEAPLHEAVRTRFLNYAISVITARALPDVRDGLKPVQRRILYTMSHDLHLSADKTTMKCAKVVGQVLGHYHPHGDSSVYDAMVRMAQPWVMRYPLVFGQGNFGSIDGDGAAAYRYTEAKLQLVADQFVAELGQETVDFCSNFDETVQEPTVLPARVPNLMINGCDGIAVGVATKMPPHNLGEVMQACEALVQDRTLSVSRLMNYIKGPDFPTGGQILDSRAALEKVYTDGQGPIRMRGTYFIEEDNARLLRIVIDSIPYMVNKSKLVESFGALAGNRLAQLKDVRDESTQDIRIVLEFSAHTEASLVMAYIFKHTELQSTFHVNMTCLTPRGPERVNLSQALLDFIDFRFIVTKRRLEYEIRKLQERIHILHGFAKVFDALDEAIAIIRKSDGRAESCERLMKRFELDKLQADAVLDLQLYRLGRKDILAVRTELAEKLASLAKLEALVASNEAMWGLVESELREVRLQLTDKRRTEIVRSGVAELSYQETDFIVDEEVEVIITRDGWVRRVPKGTEIAKLKMRQDDVVEQILEASALTSCVFFTASGTAYTLSVHELPQSVRGGFGEPIQKFFNFADGDRIIAAFIFDPRDLGGIEAAEAEGVPPVQGVAIADDGKGLRFSFAPFAEVSKKSGRRFAKVAPGGNIVSVELVRGSEQLISVSKNGRALICPVEEISFLSGAGRGVAVMKLDNSDSIADTMVVTDKDAGLIMIREEGGLPIEVSLRRYTSVGRGGKGTLLIKRGRLKLQKKFYSRYELNETSAEPAEEVPTE